MKNEILRFQEKLLLPPLQKTPRELLNAPEWMGFGGSGIGWSDLNEQDADTLARWLGPSAFKAIRFSPNILKLICNGRRKVIAGGSCLITSADNKRLVKDEMRIADLIPDLPNLPQLVDPLLPIQGADLHLNILEDTLFAQGRPEIMGALQAQGCRHTTMLESWIRLHGAHGCVEPCFFSRFPSIAKEADAFFSRRFFQGHVATGLSRAQVAFSFTGPWADMLRREHAIPEDADYLVVEPYHHFTETMNVQMGAPDSPVHRMLVETKRFFQQFPYGEGDNAGIAGGIAFVPYLEPDGRLGFASTSTSNTCHQRNVDDFLRRRADMLSCDRIPALSSDFLYADGLNSLYLFPSCRAALFQIRALWKHIDQECEQIHSNGERKNVRDTMRTSTEIKHAWLTPHEVLYSQLERLLISVFPHARLVKLAS